MMQPLIRHWLAAARRSRPQLIIKCPSVRVLARWSEASSLFDMDECEVFSRAYNKQALSVWRQEHKQDRPGALHSSATECSARGLEGRKRADRRLLSWTRSKIITYEVVSLLINV